jgi:UDP-N-acetylglucosamine--N-acetylmuramyl-(pentapeptide) pyrophosphoryl-undecaprenol N-acetylglucosamine transferase
MSTIVFTGGGTLGHLFAGLATAEVLREIEPDARILFAGKGLLAERQQVAAAGYEYHAVPCHPWPNRPWSAAAFVRQNLLGFRRAKRLLIDSQAAVVVGLGGYSSAPVARAALHLKQPLVLLEQNAVAGRVNRWLSRRAACVCTSFEPTTALRCRNVHYTGNPVRRAFIHRAAEERAFAVAGAEPKRCPSRAQPGHRQGSAASHQKLLLVTGGSNGAAALNAAVPKALADCQHLLRDWRIAHQTGERDLATTQALYRQLGLAAEVTAFADLGAWMPRAAAVVCRAGGSTISELIVTGTPAILCPYPHARDNHQRANALALGDACRVVKQHGDDFAGRLAGELAHVLADDSLRQAMSQALLRQARPYAARQVAEIIQACLGNVEALRHWNGQRLPIVSSQDPTGAAP